VNVAEEGNPLPKKGAKCNRALQRRAEDVLESFSAAIKPVPDVLECPLTPGTPEYLLNVVAKDSDPFASIYRPFLTRLSGVEQMNSSFAPRTVFRRTTLRVSCVIRPMVAQPVALAPQII
jgi:hypothetical protein